MKRTLWYETQEGQVQIHEEELPERMEPLVILGEAGMGKTYLLEGLSNLSGYTFCSARKLINRPDPTTLIHGTDTLIIDALDEVSVQGDGDAVDLVLRQLGRLGYPNFILSCRVSDWRSATGREAILEQYSEEPLELHLAPFDESDARSFLREAIGSESANDVIEHFNARGLNGLLSNPQTLELISKTAQSGSLPDTRSELFERAIELLRVEHRDTKTDKQPAKELGLDAAGAAFAGMILTGSEALVQKPDIDALEGELQIADVSLLTDRSVLEAMLETRLFKSNGTGRFTYWHRRIGEYLGARWLAKQANTPRKRRRLLSQFHGYGLVPASLRGIHAWLAMDPALAQTVIVADPMGVIEYGDADDLTIEQAHSLIEALEKLAKENPQFRDFGPYSLRGIAKPQLIDDLRRLITSSETPVGLSALLLEAIKETEIVAALEEDLRAITLDVQAVYANRSAAGEALALHFDGKEGVALLHELHALGDEDSLRLAIELVGDIGYQEIDDGLIVSLVVDWASKQTRILGVLMLPERYLPQDRIEGVLDRLVIAANSLGKPNERPGDDLLTDFAYELIVRKLARDEVTPERLWNWLEPFNSSVGYHTDARRKLDSLIYSNQHLRLGIQSHVLLNLPNDDTMRQGLWQLYERSDALIPHHPDIIELLEELDPDDRSDQRWCDLIQLVRHKDEEGADVRAAAYPFARHDAKLVEWVESLAVPYTLSWEHEIAKQEREERRERTAEIAERRKFFTEHIDSIRKGHGQALCELAKAYLGFFIDINSEIPPDNRISNWLGNDVATAQAAHEGFETFLLQDPPLVEARMMAEANAQEREYGAGYVVVAALAERMRKNVGFDDLTDAQLLPGFVESRRLPVKEHCGIVGLQEMVEGSLEARGILEEAMQLFYEPQFEAHRESVQSLHSLMQDDAYADLSSKLAAIWLEQFPNLQIGPETELIDNLLQLGYFTTLSGISRSRLDIGSMERQRSWDAVGIITNFQETVNRLATRSLDPVLLWDIRDRSEARYSNRSSIKLNVDQLEWIIKNFRTIWPMVERPSGLTVGDNNSWDASQYLCQLIRRLGNDTSEKAGAALRRLQDASPDGYSELIKAVLSEHRRNQLEISYTPTSLAAITAIAQDTVPQSATDLQAFVLDELEVAQKKIVSDDAESWRGFFNDDDAPFAEERCRDHLMGILRQGTTEIEFVPESHIAADKEVDIACAAGKLRMPIEVKGQWHPQLWSAADQQLDTLYTPDWRAEGFGIYLVLWFGDEVPTNKQVKRPKKGLSPPQTADELRDLLITQSQSAKEGRVAIFVLDLSRAE